MIACDHTTFARRDGIVTCQVEGSLTRWPCNRAATFDVTIGCVHEHLTTEPMCSAHLDKVGDGAGVCSFCQDCSDPHECVVTLLRQVALP